MAYLVMMLVIPFANTDEEHAAAAGTPFNAQEVVDRAKKHYAQFKNDADWRHHWRQRRREWRRWKDGAYWWGHSLQRNVYQMSAHTGYFTQVFAGLMIPLLAIAGVALSIAFFTALVAITTTGTLFGWVVVGSLPVWAAALVLCLVYGLMASSLHNLRRAIYVNRGAPGSGCIQYAAWDSIFPLAALLIIGWLAYHHIPLVHEFFRHFPEDVARAMVGLSKINLDASYTGMLSILNLFVAGGGSSATAAPSSITAWDQEYQHALYATRQSSRMQRVAIADDGARYRAIIAA